MNLMPENDRSRQERRIAKLIERLGRLGAGS
jgi:hypothetical protein